MGVSVVVDFEPVGRRVESRPGKTVLEVAREIGLVLGESGLIAPCGGKGLCGRCRVRIDGPGVQPPTDNERRLLGSRLEEGYRLACQAVIEGQGAVKVVIPPDSLPGWQKLELEGVEVTTEVVPVIRRYPVGIRHTEKSYPRALGDQVLKALESEYGRDELRVDVSALAQVDPVAKEGLAWVTVRGDEVINVFFSGVPPGDWSSRLPLLGLAVDLGTTKVAGYLVDLETGATIAQKGMMNPQIAYGEDVMSRMAYAVQGESAYREIRDAIVQGLNRLAVELAQAAGVELGEKKESVCSVIEEAVIVGNTAMHHLLLGLPVAQLARAPYVPAISCPVEVKARDLGLDFSPGAYVYLPPIVAGFVGADHVAMILASRIYHGEEAVLGIDIGTNTEVVVVSPGGAKDREGANMLSCSCASGPAFEGAHISQGMRAATGAVESVELSSDGLDVRVKTIGGSPPVGICGSGIVDAVAEFRRRGVVDEKGRLNHDHSRVRRSEAGEWEFVLVSREETGTGRDIVVTQRDVGEILLAKGAIAAGIKLLLGARGMAVEDIDRVVVAGAFGTHLRLESAIEIGLLPALPRDRFKQVGNAAGTGARLTLISLPERRLAEEIGRQVDYLELIHVPEFSTVFIESLFL